MLPVSIIQNCIDTGADQLKIEEKEMGGINCLRELRPRRN